MSKPNFQLFVDQNDPRVETEMTPEEVKRVSKSILKDKAGFMFGPPNLPLSILKKFHRPYKEFLTTSFDILCKAYIHFTAHAFKGEVFYEALFEDMKANDHDWFLFFEDDNNHVWPERCVGMLGTLATIHRNRGNLEKVHEILALDERVLDRYSQIVTGCAGESLLIYI